MSFELITLRFYHSGAMKIEKRGYKGKPYHGGGVYEFLDIDIDWVSYFELRDCLKKLGYEPGQCVLSVELPRSTAILEIKYDYDTTLFADRLSHGDIWSVLCVTLLMNQSWSHLHWNI